MKAYNLGSGFRAHMPKAIAAALALGMATSGALAGDAPKDGVYADHIDWGVIMDLSGPTSSSQGVWTKGLQDYMAMLNENGGVGGRTVNVLAEDGRFNAANDKIAFDKLVSQTPVIALSGFGTSATQVALASEIRDGAVPVIGTYTPTKALSEPTSKMVYNGFCGYKQMADAGVGYMVEKLGLKNPKVMTVAIETAGGKDYADYVAAAVARYGGTASSTTMKIAAVDVTPQVQRILAEKPDFITIYGIENTAILTMKTMQQYGLDTPGFGITYLGTKSVYNALGAEAGGNYSFISCFTPGGADESDGNKAMVSYADKAGHGDLASNINYVAGWVAGMTAETALKKVDGDLTRASLVSAIEGGFTVDPEGLAAPIVYTPEDHTGPQVLKMFGYDYAKETFVSYGDYADYEKYTK